VTNDDLTPPQVQKLQAIIGRHLRYLNKLTARMNQLGAEETHATGASSKNSPFQRVR
jgi:hypothetical protein